MSSSAHYVGMPPWLQHPSTPPVRYEPAATVAFTLALISLVIWVFPAIVALAMGKAARRNIRASNGQRKGKRLAIAAELIAAAELVITALIIFAVLAS